jgi:hypothetical protein
MDEDVKYFIKSVDGRTLTVFEDRVVLSQKGIMGTLSRGLAGDKTIYYRDITSIQFKEAGWMAGFMEFTFPGSNDRTGGPIRGAAKEVNNKVLVAKEYIDKRINEVKRPQSNNDLANSAADELTKIKTLLDNNAINQDEYIKMKEIIISRM